MLSRLGRGEWQCWGALGGRPPFVAKERWVGEGRGRGPHRIEILVMQGTI